MEKARFELTVKTTWESCMALARAKAGQHSRVVWISNVLVILGVAVLWIIGSKHAIWMTAVMALLLAQTLLRVWLTAFRHYNARNAAVDEIHAEFDETGIRIRTRVEESLVRYTNVSALKEESGYLIILMRHHVPLAIPMTELQGDNGELPGFLKEKTGLEVRHGGR